MLELKNHKNYDESGYYPIYSSYAGGFDSEGKYGYYSFSAVLSDKYLTFYHTLYYDKMSAERIEKFLRTKYDIPTIEDKFSLYKKNYLNRFNRWIAFNRKAKDASMNHDNFMLGYAKAGDSLW